MRLFAAVFPPLEVRRDLVATVADLPAMVDLRLVRPENLHFTLAFFGEKPSGTLAPLAAALEAAAGRVGPFPVRAGGLSGFPAGDRARVLFAGLSAGAGPLSTLHDAVLDALPEDLRPEREGRFHPHLTLSRPRRPLAHGQFEALQRQAQPWSWEFTVDAVALVESVTGQGPARYTVRRAVGLGG